jgi:hypothetical protein
MYDVRCLMYDTPSVFALKTQINERNLRASYIKHRTSKAYIKNDSLK